jgi:hypothetical protein
MSAKGLPRLNACKLSIGSSCHVESIKQELSNNPSDTVGLESRTARVAKDAACEFVVEQGSDRWRA